MLLSYTLLFYLLSTFAVVAPSPLFSKHVPLEQAGMLSGTTWEKVSEHQPYLEKKLVTFVGDEMTVQGLKLSGLYYHDSARTLSISRFTKNEVLAKTLVGVWALSLESREDKPNLPTTMRILRNNRVGVWFIQMEAT